ncbi:MAG TPA: hypothetical protein VNQ81_16465 [Povalibacter sp.]|nr:hypothetical protein [Povalibacter sp.]
MFKRISASLALAALAASPLAVRTATAADYDEGQWVTTFTAGAGLITSNTFQSPASAALADLGRLDGSLAGQSATMRVDRLSFHDAFSVGPTLGIESGYLSNSGVEPYIRLDRSQLRGRNVRIGEMTSAALASPAAITANFDDLTSWGLDLGARYFFNEGGAARPYLAGYVGAERSDPLYAHFAVSGISADGGRQTLLPRETLFNAGVETGVSYQVSDQAALRFSVGADYRPARHEDSTAFESLGLGPVRIADQRWSVPIDLGLTYRFE